MQRESATACLRSACVAGNLTMVVSDPQTGSRQAVPAEYFDRPNADIEFHRSLFGAYKLSEQAVADPLYELIHAKIPKGSFCDPFGGVGIVGSFFKRQGYTVWTGDVLKFAHCFQVARVEASRFPSFGKLRTGLGVSSTEAIRSSLNSRALNQGWFVREYSQRRRFFTTENAGRIEYCMRQF